MKHLVISAVNLVEAGTLEVLKQCLRTAVNFPGWRVTAIVHTADLVGVQGIHYIERPDIKPSWMKRLKFEYFDCVQLAAELKPDFWLSLHDTTPRLGKGSKKVPQAVYCHNAMCFYKMRFAEVQQEPKLLIFSALYGYLYQANIQANDAVIVQQDWMRDRFRSDFKYDGKIIVAHPDVPETPSEAKAFSGAKFFYPSFPRVFKNFEVLLEAWAQLCRDPEWDGELFVTLSGEMNSYSAKLLAEYGELRNVHFMGRLSRAEVEQIYLQSDCLVFPSKLESWGLPLQEAKEKNLFILAADLPYSRETIGSYKGATFFDHTDAASLATAIRSFHEGKLSEVTVSRNLPAEPYTRTWASLLDMLLN